MYCGATSDGHGVSQRDHAVVVHGSEWVAWERSGMGTLATRATMRPKQNPLATLSAGTSRTPIKRHIPPNTTSRACWLRERRGSDSRSVKITKVFFFFFKQKTAYEITR